MRGLKKNMGVMIWHGDGEMMAGDEYMYCTVGGREIIITLW